MGGNAIKHMGYEGRRVERGEYEILSKEVMIEIIKYRSHCYFAAIPFYHNKKTFGDCDIMIKSTADLNFDGREFLLKHFNITNCYHNGGVYSFPYKGFQFDLILMSAQDFDSAIGYYAYNDLGNILGRIFTKMGVGYGHRGLFIKVFEHYFDPTTTHMHHVIGEILITKDTEIIHGLLGLDHKLWIEGFNTLEDIFKFVESSNYFDPVLFEFENLNHIDRVRNKKRATYSAFVEWVQGKEKKISLPTREEYLQKIFKLFPHVKEEYEHIKQQFFLKRAVKAKFNGALVSEWVGLKDKELGKFMAWLKDISYMNPHFLESEPTDRIKQEVLSLKEKYDAANSV